MTEDFVKMTQPFVKEGIKLLLKMAKESENKADRDRMIDHAIEGIDLL